jgi:hypothetical protein
VKFHFIPRALVHVQAIGTSYLVVAVDLRHEDHFSLIEIANIRACACCTCAPVAPVACKSTCAHPHTLQGTASHLPAAHRPPQQRTAPWVKSNGSFAEKGRLSDSPTCALRSCPRPRHSASKHQFIRCTVRASQTGSCQLSSRCHLHRLLHISLELAGATPDHLGLQID